MNFHILTLFPEMVSMGLNTSIIGRATAQGLIGIEAVNIRDYTENKHGKVDDYTYGGGAGMLLQAQPIYSAYLAVKEKINKLPRTIYVTPQGRLFDQELARELAKEEDLLILCGHYEGVDERVLEEIVSDHISIGDYVLTGGELAAMVIVDAVARMVSGVLANAESGEFESHTDFILEYPQYSRPEVWQGRRVPEILLSGDHAKIAKWRQEKALERTKERRPDLYEKYLQSTKGCDIL
jgi:tRNA (guanine37-N1)-methyltransferase